MNIELQELSKKQWYTQGFAARPLFMFGVPSLDLMKEGVGFHYTVFPMIFKDDYCEWNYLVTDFKAHEQMILEKITEDVNYLNKKREYFEKELEKSEKVFLRAEKDLTKLPSKEIFSLARELIRPLELTTGVAHLIESISLRLEHDIRALVKAETDQKQKNSDFSILTSPVTSSFLSRKDEVLWKIKNSSGKKRKKLVETFIKDFFWIDSSYVKNNPLDEKIVEKMAEELESFSKQDFSDLKNQKARLFKKYSFSLEQKKLVEMAEFLTDWQDERKARIYRGIFSVSCYCREISRRYNIEEKLVHYLLLNEFNEKDFLDGTAKRIAEERVKGVLIVRTLGKFEIFTGKDFEEFMNAMHGKNEAIERINGFAASLGTATGVVKIVTNIESLEKVQKGDVLVASMTRPEYVTAMKKAVAIVTDEGGVTCHAAIISRELGIPCVVGTKVATKTLKDGWIVEVKANHGQVIVLEKN